VKAKVAETPYEYRWSSLYYIMRNDKRIKWFDHKISLSLIGSKEDLVGLLDNEDIPSGVEVVYNQFIGDKKWADALIDKNRLNEEISGSSLMEKGYITAEEIMWAVTQKYKIAQEALLRGEHKLAAMIAMYIMNVHTPMKLEELGELFRLKKFTVAQRLWRFKKRDLATSRIQKIIKSLEKQLLKR